MIAPTTTRLRSSERPRRLSGEQNHVKSPRGIESPRRLAARVTTERTTHDPSPREPGEWEIEIGDVRSSSGPEIELERQLLKERRIGWRARFLLEAVGDQRLLVDD